MHLTGTTCGVYRKGLVDLEGFEYGVGPQQLINTGKRDVISKSMQLVAGRTGQEYNQRKNRRGAYWEDRYHATAVESYEHLARCLVYIDANMVRAGVVSHPSEWSFSGYNEIQEPRRKNVLIDSERLQGLLGAASYDQLRRSHKGWVEEHLGDEAKERQDEWTDSVAVGSKSFIESVKAWAFGPKAAMSYKAVRGINCGRTPHPIMSFLRLKTRI